MYYLYSFLLFFLISNVWGGEFVFPKTCKPLVVKTETIEVSADKPSMILIHNLSSIDLWVTHPIKEANASAGWTSHLQAGNWSGLALMDKNFELSCIESKPGHEQQVPCQGLLAICQWSDIKYPKDEKGTFWAGENMSLDALTTHLGSRGFIMSDNQSHGE